MTVGVVIGAMAEQVDGMVIGELSGVVIGVVGVVIREVAEELVVMVGVQAVIASHRSYVPRHSQ